MSACPVPSAETALSPAHGSLGDGLGQGSLADGAVQGSFSKGSVNASLSKGTTALIGISAFGAGMAFIVPLLFTLAHRVAELYPGRDYLLGSVLAGAAVVGILMGPIVGMFSDRHRSRFGRRRPFMAAGAAVGLAGLPILAFAPSLPILTLGWLVASAGWATAMSMVLFTVADVAPPHQRGQLMGFVGMATQISPVAGVPLVGLVTGHPGFMFGVPTVIGIAAAAVFCLRIKEADTSKLPPAAKVTFRTVLASFLFNPMRHRGFAYAWAGRFMFFLGMGMAISFQTFFVAQRLGIPVSEIMPVVATISLFTAVPAMLGSVVLGRVSDKIGRGPIIAFATLVYASGSLVLALAGAMPTLIGGTMMTALGFAAFMAAGQATVLDVLPDHRQTGRYMAINQFAQKAPTAFAPLLGPALMSLGSTYYANYTALMLGAGLCALFGGLFMFRATRNVPVRNSLLQHLA